MARNNELLNDGGIELSKEKSDSRLRRAMAALAGGALVFGAAGCGAGESEENIPTDNETIAVEILGSDDDNEPTSDTETTEATSPTSETTEGGNEDGETAEDYSQYDLEPVYEGSPEQYRLSADLSAEELVQGSADIIEAWTEADSTGESVKQAYENWLEVGGDPDEYVQSLAEENAEYYSQILFPDNWQDNEYLVRDYEYIRDGNKQAITANLSRMAKGDGDILWDGKNPQVRDVKEYFEKSDVDTWYGIPQEYWDMVARGEARIIRSYVDYERHNVDGVAGVTDNYSYRSVDIFDISDGTARLVWVGGEKI